jgi:hypothetical protein
MEGVEAVEGVVRGEGEVEALTLPVAEAMQRVRRVAGGDGDGV